ncbi:MAG: extracellular solute-binding protein [OCS116 cluster bacterium]|uniref:Iron ABC transporter substrate-binding protein n=1 Tax=OCS116 cluster bacterium TaxID=2030921 RepID=A0A2A4YUZ4_9PROT|nr:extracellular solute-binding protein [OCS116 cluster bacterium]
MKKSLVKSLLAVTALASFIAPQAAIAAEEINIYSYRQPFLMQPIIDQFHADTGITVNSIYANKGLVEKVKAAQGKGEADLILTVDIGRLIGAVDAGLADEVSSDVLTANIPAEFRDADGKWFGITTRARVVYASKERVSQDAITYEELADPKWKGKICIRSGQHAYNLALFASMIAHHGEADAQKWLEGLKANLAHSPKGNDRAQAQSIYNGECDLALANTYYMGKMQTNDKNPEQKDWAASVKLIFPNAADRGSHMNLSGVMVVKGAKNKDNAVKFIEYLSGDKAQKLYAEANFEYPVKAGVEISELVQSWGALKADSLALTTIAKHRKRASELVDIVGFDD